MLPQDKLTYSKIDADFKKMAPQNGQFECTSESVADVVRIRLPSCGYNSRLDLASPPMFAPLIQMVAVLTLSDFLFSVSASI
jgi:hypothetical protein